MAARALDYLYILATVGLTVYGQLILKWRLPALGPLPADVGPRLRHLLGVLLDPWVFSGFAAAFLASLAWMVVLTRFELSHAYPFMSLNFVVVLLLSGWLLAEPITAAKTVGVALIMLGTLVVARG